MDFQKTEADGMDSAAKKVAQLLQRPEHLERVDQYRRKFTRQKAAVDARLKTAVQTQLDDVKTGLSKLRSALEDVREIKKSMTDIDSVYQSCQELDRYIKPIREASWQHTQLAAAVEHLKHIYTVPTVVSDAEQLISESNLLAAHKNLQDLENTRDELLFQIHKSSEDTASTDHSINEPLIRYFQPVATLSATLAKQLWFILQGTLHTVRSNPTILVTALRIVEREERADARAFDRKKQTGFLPPGRPKKWREKALEVIKSSINVRFEGIQLETRDTNKAWLIQYLVALRRLVTEDLTTVKTLGVPRFPPTYGIFMVFVEEYHAALRNIMEDVAGQRMEAGEVISLLSWVRDYAEMMLDPELGVDVSRYPPLLTSRFEKELEQQYLRLIEETIGDWLKRMLEAEVKDWHRETEPQSSVDKYFQTDMPVLLGQMLSQNLDVVEDTGSELKMKVMRLFVKVLGEFQVAYQSEITQCKNKHIADGRRDPPYFLQYMIATANNCHQLKEYTSRLKTQALGECAPDDDQFFEQQFTVICEQFETIALNTALMLGDMVFMDLDSFLLELLTKKWINSAQAIQTVDVTIRDYANDFKSLRPSYYGSLMTAMQRRLIVEYIRALCSRRHVFKNYEERKTSAQKIKKESKKIAELFVQLSSVSKPKQCSILDRIADLIEGKDTEMLDLEIQDLVNKHPDMTGDHLLSLLSIRGDVSKSQAKQIVARIKLPEETDQADGKHRAAEGFFADISS